MFDDDPAGWMRWMREMQFGPWGHPHFEQLMQRMDDELVQLDELVRNQSVEALRWWRYLGALDRDTGPTVRGYSIAFDPDGKLMPREFGNMGSDRPSQKSVVTPNREPLVEAVDTESEFRVTLDLPGAKKEDIDLTINEGKLTVSVDGGKRRYHKEVGLPNSAKPEGARSKFNNGILEVVLPKEPRSARPIRLKLE